MSKYFQPFINFGPDAVKGSNFLSDSNFWFDKARVIQRNKTPVIVNSKDIPKMMIKEISRSFNICGYKKRPIIMGVLNLSPDSFSENKKFPKTKISNSIKSLIKQGVNIIDIGGESTRPNFTEISADIEIQRIKKAFKSIKKKFPHMIFSIDTRKSVVADYALTNGATILNDVSSLKFDPSIINVIKKHKCFVCIMHNSGDGKEIHKKLTGKNFLLEIYDYLLDRINYLVSQGIPKSKIIIDPGIGFGKSLSQNLNIISNITLYHSLGCPLLVGLSRKGFIGKITGEIEPEKRMLSSVILAFELIKKGVHIIRVHDVEETYEMVKIFNSLKLKS